MLGPDKDPLCVIFQRRVEAICAELGVERCDFGKEVAIGGVNWLL